jgi:hypothetical protein
MNQHAGSNMPGARESPDHIPATTTASDACRVWNFECPNCGQAPRGEMPRKHFGENMRSRPASPPRGCPRRARGGGRKAARRENCHADVLFENQ